LISAHAFFYSELLDCLLESEKRTLKVKEKPSLFQGFLTVDPEDVVADVIDSFNVAA